MSISPHAIFRLGAGVRDALLAQDCMLCQARSGNQILCAACEAELPASGCACPRCALPGSSDAECGACIADPPHFDASHAAFAYAFPVDALIQALKYREQFALAGWFARRLAQRIGRAVEVDLILPMPLHPARLAARGFNQAAEIAKVLARESGIPFDLHCAKRIRDTAPQTELPWRERKANIRHAFSCARDLSGLSVAVVDDVMTTGATLNELAQTLKKSGASRVQNWVVARTPHGD